MNEFNFDSLKNIPIPEELISRALEIPENTEPKAAPISMKRRLMATAGFVLVFAVSIYAYFLFGNMNEPRVPVATSAPSQTELSEPSVRPTGEQPAHDASEEPSVQPTSGSSEKPSVSATEKHTQKPTEGHAQKPTRASEKPAERPSQGPVQRPSVSPTENPTQPAPPDEPGLLPTEPEWPPTEAPTDIATAHPDEPPPQAPTSEPDDDPHVVPDEPSEPPTEPSAYINYMPFRLNGRQISGGLYCSFTDRYGSPIGALEPYSPYNKAEYYIKGDWVYVSYERARVAGLTDLYCYAKIYDAAGTLFLTQRIYL